jgi:SPP1 family predicted phage head-tail adaptor
VLPELGELMPWPYPWEAVKDPLIIPSGALRNAIQIQSQSTTQDGVGQQIPTWSSVLTCFAAIETMRTGEQFQEGFVSRVVHRISIRWPGPSISILASMRVVVDPVAGGKSSVYKIQAVENVQQRNRVVRMTCLEIDNAQVSS